MKFSEVDVICFDADYTLVKYTNENFIHLTYTSLANSMIKLGAPSELLTILTPQQIKQLSGCGLIADFRTGCMLKLSSDFSILKAYHGLTPCTNLEELFGNPPIYPLTCIEKFLIKSERYLFHTQFNVGGSILWMSCVELMKTGKYPLANYIELCEVFYRAVGLNYYSLSNSCFYSEVFEHPELYVQKISENFKQALRDLKAQGKKLAVVTNSLLEYSNFVLEYSYGPEWHSLFDAYVYSAHKPEFFYHDNELEIIENLNLDGEAYIKGSSRDLKERLGGHAYCFVGDHLVSDVHGAKKYQWMTVAVVEEIFYEKGIKEVVSRDVIEASPQVRTEGDVLDYYECWGSHFVNEGKTTFWWDFVQKHADGIIPKIECLPELFKLSST